MIRTLQARLHSLSKFHIHNVRLKSLSQKFLGVHGRSSSRIAGIPRGHKGLSTKINTCNGIKAFCTAQDLSMKKCVPCSSKDLRPMTEDAAHQLIPQVPGWNLVNEGGTWKLHRSWKVKSFTKGLEFFQLVADVAEAEGHHPDLHLVGWNNIKIDIWTHAVGGLTENDFILASKINGLDLHHLLSKKTAK
ncbi:Transcriptional coactivator/pterin dehydratase [Abeliophyllum distichum]|uniref:4a-hydroxytetrahydrobiopterin dehydratase n=1 Tax=Abeliophyllum distichum TaxID=126358 RepID=A0ABD1UIJ7_9LAMI